MPVWNCFPQWNTCSFYGSIISQVPNFLSPPKIPEMWYLAKIRQLKNIRWNNKSRKVLLFKFLNWCSKNTEKKKHNICTDICNVLDSKIILSILVMILWKWVLGISSTLNLVWKEARFKSGKNDFCECNFFQNDVIIIKLLIVSFHLPSKIQKFCYKYLG